MKVICHMIVTPNGYIARSNGKSVSTPYDWKDFDEGVKRYNNFVTGRKTLDVVGEQGFADSECEFKVIVSNQDLKLDPSFTIVHSPQAAIDFLQNKVDALFLVGGSELNTAFAKAGLIDEIVLILEPYMIGKGVKLFAESGFELPLVYKKVEELEGGRIRITYGVQK